MATFQSDIIIAGNTSKLGVYPSTAVATVTFTAAIAANDLIELVKIPPGCYLTDFLVDVPEMDINATATITYDLEDDLSSPTTIVSQKAQPNSDGVLLLPADIVIGAMPLEYSAPSGSEGDSVGKLRLKVVTGPATAQTTFPETLRASFTFVPK